MTDFPYIYTFYSFKGGVGRSMALLNVAYALIARGRHVLVMDMDLEAPGISGFLVRNDELEHPPEKDAIDLLTMLVQWVRNRIAPEQYEEKARQLGDDARPYATPVKQAKLKHPALHPRLGWQGRLDVIGVNPNDDYCERLESLQLSALTRQELQDLGNAVRAFVKTRRIELPPYPGTEGIPGFGPRKEPYDYVLVDSRTGITETGGLCVGLLSDRLVVLTGLNDQNVSGTRQFLKEIGLEPREWFTEDKDVPWDAAHKPPRDDSQAPRGLGPKPTLIVASPVPAGEIEYRESRVKQVEAQIGPVAYTLSYHPRLALMETIFVRDYSKEYISREYFELTELLMAGAQDHHSQLAARSQALREKDWPGAVQAALRLTSAKPEVGQARLQLLSDWAVRKGGPSDTHATCLLYAVLSQDSAEQRELALNNWGNALSDWAKTKQGPEADALFQQACDKHEQAVKLNPNFPEALYNWGATLADWARTKQGPEADALFRQACAKCEQAVKLKPDFPEALNNWGNALLGLAKTKQGLEADALFQQGCEKYEQAVKLKPGYADALNNWGVALIDWARTKQGPEADALFQQACAKCEQAVKLKPDYANALNNWGAALAEWAKTKQGPEADALFHQAEELLLKAEKLEPGCGAYNLACVAARRGQKDQCRKWLERMVELRPQTRQHVEQDPDLESVRNEPWFREILSRLK